MMKFLSKFCATALAFTLTMTPVTAEVMRQITVQGQGVIASEPNLATVQIGVQKRAKTPADAMEQTDAAAQNVVARLKEMGISGADMQTYNLSLNVLESYGSNNQRRVEGYEAANTLNVRIRDLDQVGAVLTAVVADGANHFHGLRFALANPRPAQDAARQAAVKDALAKAALYAEAAGAELGDVLSISTITQQGVPMPMVRLESVAMSDMPVEAGEVELTQTVTLVIELK